MASQREPIAIVGSGCRFPGGSTSPASLWELLLNPRDIQKEIPRDRFDVEGYHHPDGAHHGTTNVRHAYLLDEDVRNFDSGFFNISRKEAESIDPQQRILMETVYEAMESGGHTIEAMRGTDTAVYVGVMGNDYEALLMRDVNNVPTYTGTGISRAILSNRISYFFDWHGPSLTIDTACSSSLIAVHQGVQALRSGESGLAVACGTTMILGPEPFVIESKLNMLSPTGRSQMWDANADGYARGEGVAVVILKRLSDAIADGNHIECVIRETGTNQDGRSTGLTVPSSEAQADLIRQTYNKAGLDIRNPNDRPQFFEAHGTGTKAGDPREAEAIQRCFGPDPAHPDRTPEHPLYVGSVKTIIGHTEGAAGLAGLLKASLAVQHGVIPPNLLFTRLSPDVEPFYHGLNIPTRAVSWPVTPEGVPRRVSINSFGFGGANAHAILESYQPPPATSRETLDPITTPFTPFTFSAVTEGSLVSLLDAYSNFLKTREDINLRDLAWTLQTCKSVHPVRVACSASTVDRLVSNIDDIVGKMKRNEIKSQSARSAPVRPRILGVFTGQGAQWATMGGHLIRSSPFVRERLGQLQNSLDTLKNSDRPSWRLEAEILADQEVSRIGEAALSQPLCTAIQIILVDLLRKAGITFEAVVGHSSGEIACAYTADFISAHDAIRIAYYRGLHAKLARGPKGGQKGAMLAVGTSLEDAQDLIDLPAFRGRLTIAAHNSSASVTLSGNLDAIAHAKMVFDEEKKFSRMLKVDTAYHSHHMTPCGDPYIQSMRECRIVINQERNTSCSWYSSVTPGEAPIEYMETLRDVYWRDNMVKTVLFADAIRYALSDKLNFALEVGPHPSLQGPATQNISDVRTPLHYSGVLSRGEDDIEAFSDTLGSVWAQLGSKSVDFWAYEKLMSGGAPVKFLSGLPSYQWNHERSHWHESRRSKRLRSRASPFHELLGVETPDSTDRDRRWANMLKASEIRWLDGHALQGQTVFPAAGYIGMALESAKKVAGDRDVSLFEIRDFIIGKAISFEDDANFAVETLVTLTGITSSGEHDKTQHANFSCYSCANNGAVAMDIVASGKVTIVYGTSSPSTLSSTPLLPSNMNDIDAEVFYSSALELGYQYTGSFRGMSSIKRKLDQASAMVPSYTYSDDESPLVIHPAPLDMAFQSLMVAFSHPEDEGMRTLHVPTSIGSLRVNPGLCAALPTSEEVKLPVSAVIHRGQDRSICGSIDIFSEDGQYTLIQTEDLAMKALTPATADDDRRLFTYMKWGCESPNAESVMGDDQPSVQEIELATLCERMSYFYLNKWKKEISEEEWANGQWHHQRLRDYVNHALSIVSQGGHPWVKEEWAEDTFQDIMPMINRYATSIDVKMLQAVGENIPSVVRGETTMLEHIVKDNIINDIYVHGLGLLKYNGYLASIVQQLVHRYPNARILEIGAGTGGTTKEVLRVIGDTFSSYTFTDISEGFFENAADWFKAHSSKMAYKVLDIEKAPAPQGFEAHSYDIIIAANVLHATSSIEKTLENTRQLLKPGGYLVLFEITQSTPLRFANLTAGLSGWWNAEDGRTNGPLVAAEVWHAKLRKTGFSGIDDITPTPDPLTSPYSIIVSQAVNNQVNYLRRPLVSSSPLSLRLEDLVIVGSASLESSRIAEELSELLGGFCDNLVILPGLPTEADTLAPMNTLISLVDLDDPVFKNLDRSKMDGLKRVYESSRNIIWVTRGAQADDPYQMASIGFGRALKQEKPYLTLGHLDLSHSNHNAPKVIAECLLRQCALEEWQSSGSLSSQGLLWSQEPELLLENGLLMVPRYVANHDQNARINSLRRAITRTVSPADSVVSISWHGDGPPSLREDVLHVPALDNRDVVRVQKSILTAINVGPGAFSYLSIGVNKATKTTTITLSNDMSSEITPVAAVPFDFGSTESASLLAAVAGELLAASLLSTLLPGSNVLVHEPGADQYFARALTTRAAAKDVRVFFTTEMAGAGDRKWTILDAWTPRHYFRKKLPAGLTHFLDLNTDAESNAVSLRIVSALPLGCRCLSASDLFRRQSSPMISAQADLVDLLQDAVSNGKAHAGDGFPLDWIIPLGHISNAPAPRNPCMSVVDWMSTEALTVHVEPLDTTRLFSKDKTYILVGLTGQIGQSMCEWMAKSGAGCVCLTSRRPNVNSQWLESVRTTGTIIKIFAMDVSDKQAVKQVVDEIRASCPPIAGVGNGAMVLQDVLFSDMSLDQMQQVLRPKIDGSNHLHEVLQKDKLDFFIMFSSVSSIIGNPGQSNYAAACAYMQSLANQRRKQGLAASTFDIGRVVGIGYVERAEAFVKEQLIRFRYMPISEADFHQLFAETILAGIPALKGNPVVTTALPSTTDEEEFRPHWFGNPRFSHCIIVNDGGSKARRDDMNTSLPVMEQLSKASSMEEALEILQASFIAKLSVILQITDGELDPYTPVIEHGLDSLVAVEVRSWFVKELKVDMPVLKILGGASIADLSEQALKGLPEKVLSSIRTGTGSAATKPSSVKQPVPLPESMKAVSKPSSPASSSNSTTPPSATPDNETVADSSSGASSPGPAQSPKLGSLKNAQSATKYPPFIKSELMSFAQSRFWFLRLLLTDQTTFTVAFFYKITGNLRIGDLEQAIRTVGSRQEAFRTWFVADEEGDIAYQKVAQSSKLRLEQKKIASASDVAAEYAKLRNYQFDIERGELMRLVLLSLSPSSHFLLVGYHHVLMDGVGFQIFIANLEKAYMKQSLGILPRPMTAFSADQRRDFESGKMDDALKFWRGEFSDGPPLLPILPMARVTSRTPLSVYNVNQGHRRLNPDLTAKVKLISKTAHSTPFHFYLAVFKAMLFKFTDVDDLTIGLADANRGSAEAMGTVGLFLNLLALRFRRQRCQKFADAITEARNATYKALSHSSLPFDVLLKELNVPRSSTHSPLFQAFFDFRQGAQEKHSFGDCQFEIQDAHPGRTAYDITLDVTDSATETVVAIRTQMGLYDEAATNLLLDTYVGLVETFSSDIEVSLENVPLFSAKQLTHAVDHGRGPDLTSDWPETLPHRIDRVAINRSGKTALMDGLGNVLTYRNMIHRIEAIGEALVNAGISAGSKVLVFQQATADWVCSMLAIMRVGAIYVPLDLRNPLPRLANITQDCQPDGILVDLITAKDAKHLVVNVPQPTKVQIIDVSTVGSKPSSPVPDRATANSVAAILYTSGSTGTPKGILVKHSGLRNEIEGYTKTWKLGAERVLQQSSFTFNHSSDQIYTALVNGGMAYIVPSDKRGDPLEVTNIIKQHNISYTKATPSEYALWLQYGLENLRHASHWRFAFGGGETLKNTLLRDFTALDLPQLRFFNSYGPTEISISSHKMEIAYRTERPSTADRIPCGYSLPNYVTYILDEQLQPVPPGMPGEIVIGGSGVSLGYINDEKLSNKAFLPNPYATHEDVARGWTRMYRTGDIGHLAADGALVFHNRIAGDTQIKIRGLRIELSDIESNIVSTSGGMLREAVVTLREGDPEILVAHVVFAPQHNVTDKENFLQTLLQSLPIPQYMIPVVAVPLDRLPLSTHAKVDRKAVKDMPLPQHLTSPVGDAAEVRFNRTMVQLKQVWEDILGNRELRLKFDIKPATSFFSVGGNSLLMIRLQSRIRTVFHIVIRLVDLLGANTLDEMARKIDESISIDIIDWDKETALPNLYIPGTPADLVHTRPVRTEVKTVLLTGATGYLAKYLLTQLVTSPKIDRIIAVAVRDAIGSPVPRQLPIVSPKIDIITGDLAQPRLGLAESAFAALAAEVDLVLHMGASHSFWDSYHTLRPVNVTATKELVRLAAARGVPIHYVSSAGVLPHSSDLASARSAAAFVPPPDGSDGYVASRWASEKVLEAASRKLGLPTLVHRYVPASASKSVGTVQPVLDEFVRFVDISGLMPDLGGWKGRIDMMAAEVAVAGIFDAIVGERGERMDETRFAHYECDISLDVEDIKKFVLERRGGAGYEKIEGHRWVGRIKALGFGYLFATQNVTVQEEPNGGTEQPKLLSRR